ncbi:hypothetical protein [Streptomyces scopuliridis]
MLTPYARSRQVPASLAAALIATVAARSLTRGTGSGDPVSRGPRSCC